MLDRRAAEIRMRNGNGRSGDVTNSSVAAVAELVPTLMIDDAETKMRTEASVLFELKTSVPFCYALQICELIYVDIYLARSRQVLR
jgi:hypothetical protein